MDAAKRLQTLRAEVAKHDRLYYVEAKPKISDRDYDKLYKELVELEAKHPELADPTSPTQRVGNSLGSFVAVKHKQKMLSLDNTYDEKELRDFDERVRKALGDKFTYSAELKIDGAASTLWYEKGVLVKALTRGDGEKGDDITANVRTIRAVPLRLQTDNPPDFVEIRGEIYMPRTEFARLNKEREEAGDDLLANPRNAAAGSLKQKDPREAAKRGLNFFCYGTGDMEGLDIDRHSDFISLVKGWGVPVVRSRTCKDVKEVWKVIQAVKDQRHKLNYDTDGVVVKVDEFEFQAQMGTSSRSPKWGIAYKYEAERAETTLLKIDIQVGKTGVLAPVARLKPVHLAGSTIENATLFNQDNIDAKDIRIGDRVLIEKGGEIIPQVVEVLKAKRTGNEKKFKIPGQCPSCGSKASKKANADGTESAAIYCPNQSCPAQAFERIRYFVSKKCMDMDGVGESLIEKLLEKGKIKNAADLYSLTEDDFLELDNVKEKSAKKYCKAISDSKARDLSRLITSLNIPSVGKTMGTTFADHFQTLKAFVNAKKPELEAIDGVGSSMAEAVVSYFKNEDNRNFVRALVKAGINMENKTKRIKNALIEGKTFVLTGTLSKFSRDEASDMIKQRGGKTSGSVSKNTDFVLAGEKAGSKLDKARSLNVKIIDEVEFEKMLT